MNFDKTELALFNNKLSAPQRDGMQAVLNEWFLTGNTDKRHLAYILATIYHETGKTMQPVKEFGGEAYLKGKPYYHYYGRDLVQTTWLKNYERVKEFSGIDVVSEPDLIGQMPLAAKVAITFMSKGWYTGRKLSDYFSDTISDPYNARRIINGTDKAQIITGYWQKFYDLL